MTILNQDFWDNQYATQQTGWDIGGVSPPLKLIIDQIEDKDLAILIPGCGNAYEAQYLVDQGFTNVTLIDISPTLVNQLQQQFAGNEGIKVICEDFFEHQGQYDLILDQTFFCALEPQLRTAYVKHMSELLKPNGLLRGVLFNRTFDREGPPFGGNTAQYYSLFSTHLNPIFIHCDESIEGRQGHEVYVKAGRLQFL